MPYHVHKTIPFQQYIEALSSSAGDHIRQRHYPEVHWTSVPHEEVSLDPNSAGTRMIAGNPVIDDRAQRVRPSKRPSKPPLRPPLRPPPQIETSTRLFGTSQFAAEIESIAKQLVQLRDQESEKQWYSTEGHYTSRPHSSPHPAVMRPAVMRPARALPTSIDPRSRAPRSESYPWPHGSPSEDQPRQVQYAREVNKIEEEKEYAREDEEWVPSPHKALDPYCEAPMSPSMDRAKWTPSVDNARIFHAQGQMDRAREDVEEAVIDRQRIATGRPRIRDTLLLYGFES